MFSLSDLVDSVEKANMNKLLLNLVLLKRVLFKFYLNMFK